MKGSMTRYADLVQHAFRDTCCERHVDIQRINLALPWRHLMRVPVSIRSWVHHSTVALAAMTKLRRRRAQVFHIADGSHAYVVRSLAGKSVVVTSHDVIPLLQAKGAFRAPTPSRQARWLIHGAIDGLRQANHVVADSENTAMDLRRVADVSDTTMSVVYPPVRVGKPTGVPWIQRRQAKGAYILHVGNNAFYKNRLGVIRVFARIGGNCDIRLKMVGPAPAPEISQLTATLGMGDRVEFVVDPDDSRLEHLYRGASLLLFPSLYEGFGWPPIEAMAHGCPVVCSSAGSLSEVVGNAALVCSADDEDQLARNCLALVHNSVLAEQLTRAGFRQARKFSLEQMAEGLLNAYLAALSGRGRKRGGTGG